MYWLETINKGEHMPIPTSKTIKEPDYLKKIYLMYGSPKAGKTTTVAGFGDDKKNKILFFCTEPGHKFQEIYAWKNDEGEYPCSWLEFKNFCREVATTDHDFKALAIDTLDNLWKWCELYMCAKLGIDHQSDMGFGKGYHAVRDEFFKPINYLTQKGYGIIFLSHESSSERQVGPKKITYIDTTLPGTCKKLIHGLCDYILYFGQDEEGKRYIRTKANESINAGDRSGELPEFIDMDPKKLTNALKGEKNVGK